jgi:catechol 2,3-dioxygenase-like lactoylglutathione lyase family enzyme
MTLPAPTALHHTCFVVRDVEKTARALTAALGIGPWNVWTLEPSEFKVGGVNRKVSFRLALTTIGGGTYELVSPHTGVSAFDEHLATRGEGFHHTCLLYSTAEALRSVKADLIRQGRTVIQEGSADDVFEFVYVAFPEIDSAVELLYLDLSRMPPPEMVI